MEERYTLSRTRRRQGYSTLCITVVFVKMFLFSLNVQTRINSACSYILSHFSIAINKFQNSYECTHYSSDPLALTLVAANIPYCIKPRSKARCILSRQYPSLRHLRYLWGLKMKPRGSYTPTQLEWRHEAIVCVFQSSVVTLLITPVASIISAYFSMEMKYGWVLS